MRKNSSGFAQILMIVLLLIGLGSLGLYYISTRQNTSPLSLPTQSPAVSSSPASGPTVNWQTYTDKILNFSFKYPPYFTYIKEIANGAVYLAPSAGSGESQGSPIGLPAGSVWLAGDAMPANNISSLDAFLNLEGVKDYYAGSTRERVLIDGLPGYKISRLERSGPLTKVFDYEGLVLKNDKIYKISLSSYETSALRQNEKIFDQILSTFKFTN